MLPLGKQFQQTVCLRGSIIYFGDYHSELVAGRQMRRGVEDLLSIEIKNWKPSNCKEFVCFQHKFAS